MKPPTEDAITCVSAIRTIAVRPARVTATPELVHGEAAENPMPVPRAMSARVSAAVAMAPAKIADQDTADADVSFSRPVPPKAAESLILAGRPLLGYCAPRVRRPIR